MSAYYWVAIISWSIAMVLFGHMIRTRYNTTPMKKTKGRKRKKKEKNDERLK